MKRVKGVLLFAVCFVPISLYGLKGTAVRRIVNYSPYKFMMYDSNGKFFRQEPAVVNRYSILVPTVTDYHKTNDPEIKQNEETPANLFLYTQQMYDNVMKKEEERVAAGGDLVFFYGDPYIYLVAPNFSLSDYDWRIWSMAGPKRSNTVLYDKQYLKKKYREYRINAAKKSLSALEEGIKSATTGSVPNVGVLEGLIDLANKPETKDVRLYVMPDKSIIFTPNYDKEGDTTPDTVIKDLVARYDGDPDQDYRFLYTHVMDELLKNAAYQDALDEALEGYN